MLILSILLSLGILIYYFRSNQNFYPKNGFLKAAAYLWLVQNAVLSVSVLIRCGYYISEYGLAYKRIGVVIFLAWSSSDCLPCTEKSAGKSPSTTCCAPTPGPPTHAVSAEPGEQGRAHRVALPEPPHVRTRILDTRFLLTRSDKTLPLLDAHREY
jgi:hypothetical protein